MMLLAIFDWPHLAADLGAPGRIRTRDPLLRRQLLYPAELQALTHVIVQELGNAEDTSRNQARRPAQRATAS